MKYNRDINEFGGIQDYHMIYEALSSYVNGEENIREQMIKANAYGVRTESTRSRYFSAIKSSILSFVNDQHKEVYYSFFKNVNSDLPYNFLIFWQLSINNKLFKLLSENVYLKYYFNGKVSITSDEVNAYILHLKVTDPEFNDIGWSKSNISTVASKYLTTLRKLGFLEGAQKKQIKHIQISDNVLAVYLYLVRATFPKESNMLCHYFQPFSFIPEESFAERIKRVAQKGLIDMSFTGTSLSIQPKINFNDLANGIYGRS